jgi:hypothetical protein
MESKVNKKPKKKRQMSIHKLIVLTELMCDELDSVSANSTYSKQVRIHSKALQELLEPMLSSAYEANFIKNSTYMQSLTSKVDTVIRKNFMSVD